MEVQALDPLLVRILKMGGPVGGPGPPGLSSTKCRPRGPGPPTGPPILRMRTRRGPRPGPPWKPTLKPLQLQSELLLAIFKNSNLVWDSSNEW